MTPNGERTSNLSGFKEDFVELTATSTGSYEMVHLAAPAWLPGRCGARSASGLTTNNERHDGAAWATYEWRSEGDLIVDWRATALVQPERDEEETIWPQDEKVLDGVYRPPVWTGRMKVVARKRKEWKMK